MKHTLLKLSLTLALGVVAGCHRIQIHNGPRAEVSNFEQGQWHHIGVIGLVEFSPPVDLSKQCPGLTWQTTQVQKSVIPTLVQILTFGLYTPWDVNMLCGKAK